MGIPLIGVFELLLISWHLQAAPILLPQDVPLSQSKFMVTQLKNPLVEGTATTIFSPDETKLIVITRTNLQVIDLSSDTIIYNIKPDLFNSKHTVEPIFVSVSPDSRYLAYSLVDKILILELKNGVLAHEIPLNTIFSYGPHIQFSSNGSIFAYHDGDTVKLLNLSSWNNVGEFSCQVGKLFISENNNHIGCLENSFRENFKAYDIKSSKILSFDFLNSHIEKETIHFSSDGKSFFAIMTPIRDSKNGKGFAPIKRGIYHVNLVTGREKILFEDYETPIRDEIDSFKFNKSEDKIIIDAGRSTTILRRVGPGWNSHSLISRFKHNYLPKAPITFIPPDERQLILFDREQFSIVDQKGGNAIQTTTVPSPFGWIATPDEIDSWQISSMGNYLLIHAGHYLKSQSVTGLVLFKRQNTTSDLLPQTK